MLLVVVVMAVVAQPELSTVRPSRVTSSGGTPGTPLMIDLRWPAAVVLDRPQDRPGEQVADD